MPAHVVPLSHHQLIALLLLSLHLVLPSFAGLVVGKEFVFAFLQCGDNRSFYTRLSLKLINNNRIETDVTVSMGDVAEPVTVKIPGLLARELNVSHCLQINFLKPLGNSIEYDKAIRVNSSSNISVVAECKSKNVDDEEIASNKPSDDAYAVLPVSQLGLCYIVTTNHMPAIWPNELAIVSTQPNTKVKLILPGKAENITVLEHAHTVLSFTSYDDFTGAVVIANQSVAVLSGTVLAPSSWRVEFGDHSAVMMSPVENYGVEFALRRLENAWMNQTTYRIMAAYDNTTVFEEVLNRGGSVRNRTICQLQSVQSCVINVDTMLLQADKPIAVFLLGDQDDRKNMGNSFMVEVPTTGAFVDAPELLFPHFGFDITFVGSHDPCSSDDNGTRHHLKPRTTPKVDHFASVIVSCSNGTQPRMSVDGVEMEFHNHTTVSGSRRIGTVSFWHSTTQLNILKESRPVPQLHRLQLKSKCTYTVTVYGYGDDYGYAYTPVHNVEKSDEFAFKKPVPVHPHSKDCSANDLDILFFIDAGCSEVEFEYIKKFLTAFARSFDPAKVQIGGLQLLNGDVVMSRFIFKSWDKSDLMNVIDQLTYTNRTHGSSVAQGISTALEKFHYPMNNPSAADVLISFAFTKDDSQPRYTIFDKERFGISVIVIGVGNKTDPYQLAQFAKGTYFHPNACLKPNDTVCTLYQLDDYETLANESFRQKLCDSLGPITAYGVERSYNLGDPNTISVSLTLTETALAFNMIRIWIKLERIQRTLCGDGKTVKEASVSEGWVVSPSLQYRPGIPMKLTFEEIFRGDKDNPVLNGDYSMLPIDLPPWACYNMNLYLGFGDAPYNNDKYHLASTDYRVSGAPPWAGLFEENPIINGIFTNAANDHLYVVLSVCHCYASITEFLLRVYETNYFDDTNQDLKCTIRLTVDDPQKQNCTAQRAWAFTETHQWQNCLTAGDNFSFHSSYVTADGKESGLCYGQFIRRPEPQFDILTVLWSSLGIVAVLCVLFGVITIYTTIRSKIEKNKRLQTERIQQLNEENLRQAEAINVVYRELSKHYYRIIHRNSGTIRRRTSRASPIRSRPLPQPPPLSRSAAGGSSGSYENIPSPRSPVSRLSLLEAATTATEEEDQLFYDDDPVAADRQAINDRTEQLTMMRWVLDQLSVATNEQQPYIDVERNEANNNEPAEFVLDYVI